MSTPIEPTELSNQFDQLILDPTTRKIYGDHEFFNVGYWQSNPPSQEAACFALMETLLDFIPVKTGTILDVGCGLGATTQYLLKYYTPAQVVGINISPRQLERCHINAPECDFRQMDATAMSFADGYFDTILCVEAAFYFNTREKFLREAWRTLKPGGRLILADIVCATPDYFGGLLLPENTVQDIESYTANYQAIGFDSIEVVDATEACWKQHFRHLRSWMETQAQIGEVEEQISQANIAAIDNLLSTDAITYVLIAASKPD